MLGTNKVPKEGIKAQEGVPVACLCSIGTYLDTYNCEHSVEVGTLPMHMIEPGFWWPGGLEAGSKESGTDRDACCVFIFSRNQSSSSPVLLPPAISWSGSGTLVHTSVQVLHTLDNSFL